MNSKYHHLTAADRYTIDSMRKSKYSQRQIAEVLGVHAATICRELRRNVGSYGYRALLAEKKATVRRKIGRKPIKITETVAERLTSLLRQQLPPCHSLQSHYNNKFN